MWPLEPDRLGPKPSAQHTPAVTSGELHSLPWLSFLTRKEITPHASLSRVDSPRRQESALQVLSKPEASVILLSPWGLWGSWGVLWGILRAQSSIVLTFTLAWRLPPHLGSPSPLPLLELGPQLAKGEGVEDTGSQRSNNSLTPGPSAWDSGLLPCSLLTVLGCGRD